MMNFDINRKVWGVIIFVIVNSLMALFWMFATQLEPPPRPNMIYNVVLLVAHILPWVVNLGLIITGLLAKQHEFVQGYVNVIGFVAALPFIFGGVFLAGCFVYMGFSIIFYLA